MSFLRHRRTPRLVSGAVLGAWLSLALLHLLWTLGVPLGIFGDDALHILLARALRHGAFSLPDGFNIPATDPLPGFPLILALPAWIVEPRWELLRLLSFVFTGTTVFLTWRLARRFLPAAWAQAAAFLVALNTVFLLYGAAVMPDVPCAALSLALFEGLPEGDKHSWRRLSALAAGAALAALMRPQGLVLVLSLSLAIWAASGPRRAAFFSALAFLPPGAWALRNFSMTGTATGYISGWRFWLKSLWGPREEILHAARLAGDVAGRGLLGLPELPLPVLVSAGLAALALGAYGVARGLREREDPRLFAMALYAMGLMALHLTWSPEMSRYLILGLPLAWIFMLIGARPFLANSRLKTASAALVLAAIFLSQDVELVRAHRRAEDSLWPSTMDWIRRNTPPAARFQSVYHAPVMLFTGRPAIALFREDVVVRDQWLALCLGSRVGYVLLDRNVKGWSTQPHGEEPFAHMREWTRSSPYLAEVYRDPREGGIVYEIRHPEPARFLRAWRLLASAAADSLNGAGPASVRRGLREALRLEPQLATAWEALASLEQGPRVRIRYLENAARADPSSEPIRQELALARQREYNGSKETPPSPRHGQDTDRRR